MKNKGHQAELEYLWKGELKEYKKFIFLGSDARQREMFAGGVYFLWNEGALQYIGQSWFIWDRLTRGHAVTKGKLSAWVIGVIPAKDTKERLALEARCIKMFNPPLNSQQVIFDPDRHEKVVKLRQEGKTLQAIGDLFGVSRERVRQILAQK